MNKLALSLLVLISGSLSAQPYKYRSCDMDLNQPEKSTGYYFSEDCKTAYIKPPKSGNMSLTAYSSSVNDSQCSVISAKMDMIKEKVMLAREYSTQMSALQSKDLNLELALMKMENQCDRDRAPLQALEETKASYQKEVNALETDNKTLTDLIGNCDKPSASCRSDKRTLKSNLKMLRKYKKYFVKLDKQIGQAQRNVSSCDSIVRNRRPSLAARVASRSARISQLSTYIDSAVTTFKEELAEEQEVPGASLQLTFQINHNELVNAFQDQNSDLKLNFIAMPTKAMSINFSAVLDGIDAKVPLVLSSDIPGVEVEKLGEDTSQLSMTPAVRRGLLMGSSISGGVTINRLAACNYQRSRNGRNFGSLLVANIHYDYDLIAKRKYKVDYRETNLYKLIKKSSTKGGFFRTSSSASISEKSISKQWIDIIVVNQDSGFDFKDRSKLITDLKNEYLNRALIKVGMGFFKEGHPSLPGAGHNGASTASASLKKCPYYFCQYAGAVLDIANSVFGGSSTSASQSKYASAEAKQTVEEHKAIPHHETLSFIMEGK